jgi:hypothetical protein
MMNARERLFGLRASSFIRHSEFIIRHFPLRLSPHAPKSPMILSTTLSDCLAEPIAQRALLACLMIGFANGFVSAFVVLQKSALKIGTLSHALLPGIALAVLVAAAGGGDQRRRFSILEHSMFLILRKTDCFTSICTV